MDDFSRRVAERRQELELSQAELAALVGVHQTMISSIELGKKQPALSVLLRLQDALGVALLPAPASAPVAQPAVQP